MSEIGIKCDKVYRTAAKKILDAHKAAEDARTVSQLRNQWGVSELERDLQDEVLRNSEKTAWIQRRFSEALKEIDGFLSSEAEKAKDALSKLTGSVQDLETEQKRVIQVRKEFTREYEKKKEAFLRAWRYEVRRFLREMEPIKLRVGDRMQRDLENKGLVSLWTHSTKLPRYIREMLASEFQRPLRDLEKQLNALLEEFRDVFEGFVETSLPFTRSNITGFSAGMMTSLGIAGTSVVLGTGAVVGTIGSATATISSALVGAKTAAGGAAFWSSWIGSQASVNAAAASATLQASVIGTTLTSLGAVCGIGLAVLLATKIATASAKGAQANRIVTILDAQFDEFGKALGDRLDASCGEIADALAAQAEEQMNAYEAQLKAIAQALHDNDPSVKEGIRRDIDVLKELSERYIRLKNSLSAISIP